MNNRENSYLQEIVKDLTLHKASQKEQEEALQILQDRFNSVVMQTLVSLTDSEQKQRLTSALQKNENVQQLITEIGSEIPEFSEALEQALLAEYESIRVTMRSQGK